MKHNEKMALSNLLLDHAHKLLKWQNASGTNAATKRGDELGKAEDRVFDYVDKLIAEAKHEQSTTTI